MNKHKRTDTEHEVVEGLVVEVVQGHFHCQGKVRQVGEMLPALNQRLVLWLHKTTKSDNSRSKKRRCAGTFVSQSPVSNLAAVAVTVCVALRCESRGGHVGASYRLDLCDAAELVPVQQLGG